MTGKRPRDICPTCGADVALFENKGQSKADVTVLWGQHNRRGRGAHPQCPQSGERWSRS